METNSNQSATPSEAGTVKAPELGVVSGSPLSERETIETLEWVLWGMKHFDGLAAGNLRTELEALAIAGFVKCEGVHEVCDDDGFMKDPAEYDDLYVLTPAGRAVLDKDNAARDARFKASLANIPDHQRAASAEKTP